MKNLVKLIVITTLVVTAGFAITSCIGEVSEKPQGGPVQDLSQLTGTWKGEASDGNGVFRKVTIVFGSVKDGKIVMDVTEEKVQRTPGSAGSPNAFHDSVDYSERTISTSAYTYTFTINDMQNWEFFTYKHSDDKELYVSFDVHHWYVKKQ